MRRLSLAGAALALLATILCVTDRALAHCEIPCGIYGDELRFQMIEEHVVTLEKSVKAIAELQKQPVANVNQLVRWVKNKERHADRVRNLIVQYFLVQRIKPAKPQATEAETKAAEEKYSRELRLLHGMLLSAMKVKQTVKLVHVETLRSQIKAFRASYFGEGQQAHLKEHHHAPKTTSESK
ncbi:superoxide dismutase [Ni] [Planctomycetota bacterium]